VVRRTCKSRYSSGSSVNSTLGPLGGNRYEVVHISMKGIRIKLLALTGRSASGNHFGSIFRTEKESRRRRGYAVLDFWILDYFESLLEETMVSESGMIDILEGSVFVRQHYENPGNTLR
jgi:hypothetical protein